MAHLGVCEQSVAVIPMTARLVRPLSEPDSRLKFWMASEVWTVLLSAWEPWLPEAPARPSQRPTESESAGGAA